MRVSFLVIALLACTAQRAPEPQRTGDLMPPMTASASWEGPIRQCKACHTFARGGANGIGPNLWGVFGRRAGTSPGYRASPALRAAGVAGLVWDRRTLNLYIANPRAFIPGTKMVMRGIDRPGDRNAIVAFLAARR